MWLMYLSSLSSTPPTYLCHVVLDDSPDALEVANHLLLAQCQTT